MKTTVLSGNFAITIEGEINPAKQSIVDEHGITSIVHREGLSAVYKTLIPKDATGDAAKRNAVAFSQENADAMAAPLEKVLGEVGTFVVEVNQHVPGESASPMARATTLVDSFLGQKDEVVWRTVLASPKGDREELIKLAHAKGLGIQPPRAKKAA